MKIYLIRHATAENISDTSDLSDFSRKLTKFGKDQAKTIGRTLKKLAIQPCKVFTSPYIRTKQTTELIIQELTPHSNILELSELIPGSTNSDFFKAINHHKPFESIFVIGHEPNLTSLAHNLLWLDNNYNIEFKKASVMCIEVFDTPSTMPGNLKWYLTNKIMAALI